MDGGFLNFDVQSTTFYRAQQWNDEQDLGLNGNSYTISEQSQRFKLFLSNEGQSMALGEFGNLNDVQRAAQADHEAHP